MATKYMIEKANRLATLVVGCSVRLHLAEDTYLSGKIVSCKLARWEQRGKLEHAIWEVMVESGAQGAYRHRHEVRKLPNPQSPEVMTIQIEGFKREIPNIEW